MDSYIEQTNMKLQTNIVNDIKREIDSVSIEVGALDSHLTNFEDDTTSELDNLNSKMEQIEKTNSMIKTELEEVNSKMDKMEIVITKLDGLHSLLVKSSGEIFRELDELESNVGEKLDKLHGQKCSCTCSGIDTPTEAPTKPPTEAPTKPPTEAPTKPPTEAPTKPPTEAPTKPPTEAPTKPPTEAPTKPPTEAPTKPPTEAPTEQQSPCEGTGWRRVAYLNMADPDASCPLGWKLNIFDSQRVCGRASDGIDSCDPTTFSVGGEEYSQVCGKIKAYQFETALGFMTPIDSTYTTIDTRYADGVSLTHGSPRQHIWTFAVGMYERDAPFCPCDETTGTPSFVEKDYFCESGLDDLTSNIGFVSTDPLWDGKDCSANPACCSLNNPPYFLKDLQALTTDDIEARICLALPGQDSDLLVEEIELYVKWISSLTQSTAYIDQSVKLVHDNNWVPVQGCSYSIEANVCMQSPHVFLL